MAVRMTEEVEIYMTQFHGSTHREPSLESEDVIFFSPDCHILQHDLRSASVRAGTHGSFAPSEVDDGETIRERRQKKERKMRRKTKKKKPKTVKN